ncbi:MAG TPA: hypothetical protein VGS60_07920 [Actinomycetes bacterium]|jgi:hypothetical protein|nr:hypothetical protein [Actinomycetes bacterium]
MESLGRHFNLAVSQIATARRVYLGEAQQATLIVVDPAANLVTVSQHNAASAGSTSALNFTKRYQQDSAGIWTVATQAPGNTFTPAGTEDLIVVEFNAKALAGGFRWVSATIATAGTLLWVISGLARQRTPPNLRAAHSV